MQVLLLSTDDATTDITGSMILSYNFVGSSFINAPGCAACGSVSLGSAVVTTSADMRPFFARGDRVAINGVVFTVHATAPFDCTRLPLSEAYWGGAAGAASVAFESSRIGFAAVEANSATMQRTAVVAEDPAFGTIRASDKIRIAGGVYTVQT